MIRILIASPGDVKVERAVVHEVIEELRESFRTPLEAWAWDDGERVFDSGELAQTQIPDPRIFDVVVCLFGVRLGTPLPNAFEPARPFWIEGSAPPTGTQYEYLCVRDNRDRREDNPKLSRPFLLVYALSSREAWLRLLEDTGTREPRPQDEAQLKALNRFLRDPVHGIGPSRVYTEFGADGLRAQVRADLTRFLRDVEPGAATWAHGNPYAGLAPMDEAHSAVFVGRDEEIDLSNRTILCALEESARGKPAFVLLTGPSGVGKSSLARAGIAARFANRRRGDRMWRRLVVRPSELGPEPARELLRRLADSDADILPALAGRDIDLGVAPNTHAAGEAAAELRHAAGANGALLLVLDQLEEALLPQEATRYAPLFHALDLLARSGASVVLATLAGNNIDQLAGQSVLAVLHWHGGVASWPIELVEPDEPRLRRLIEEPMKRTGGEVDRAVVDRLILEWRSLRQESRGALPLIQLALFEAYEAAARRQARNGLAVSAGPTILGDDFTGLGSIVEAVGQKALASFPGTEEEKDLALRRLFRHLVRFDPDLKEVTRQRRADLLPADVRALAAHLAAERLLVADDAGYALPHIELLRRWSKGIAWLEQERRLVELRDRLAAEAKDWHAADEANKRSKLDISASLVDEAERLRMHWPDDDLGELLCTFLDKAIPYVRESMRRARELDDAIRKLSVLYLAGRSEAVREKDPELAMLIALEALPNGS